ncbi:MAG: twin-arginine translocation signal domain-containing protein [Chloroflexi bacterium]|nr:twin-arginine translocation signal domain-containing protein [Chloroflexota bacterium]
MSSVSRRGFLRTTSLGVAAFGLLSAAPTVVLAQSAPAIAPAAQPTGQTPLDSNMLMPASGGTPFIVYVSDPSSGSGTILIGEQAIPFADRALVQRLLQAIG